jgi:hypothetical protein
MTEASHSVNGKAPENWVRFPHPDPEDVLSVKSVSAVGTALFSSPLSIFSMI